ncbi:hypothetical protein FOBRF1_008391 [Fusarium oxysporum]
MLGCEETRLERRVPSIDDEMNCQLRGSRSAIKTGQFETHDSNQKYKYMARLGNCEMQGHCVNVTRCKG